MLQPRVGGLPESYVGQAQIHWWLRNMLAQHLHVDLADSPRLTGSHLSWSDNFSADSFRQLGLEVVVVDVDVELASDYRIESLRLTFTPEAARSLQLAPVAAQATGSGVSMSSLLTSGHALFSLRALGRSEALTPTTHFCPALHGLNPPACSGRIRLFARPPTSTSDFIVVRKALQRRKALVDHTIYACSGCGERFVGVRPL